jgi:hypothetical protein
VLARGLWWLGSARSELPTVEADDGDGGARRRRSSSGNWEATEGRRALVNYGKSCARVDWGGEGLVLAVHGRAVRGRSGRGRRRRNVARALAIGHWD